MHEPLLVRIGHERYLAGICQACLTHFHPSSTLAAPLTRTVSGKRSSIRLYIIPHLYIPKDAPPYPLRADTVSSPTCSLYIRSKRVTTTKIAGLLLYAYGPTGVPPGPTIRARHDRARDRDPTAAALALDLDDTEPGILGSVRAMLRPGQHGRAAVLQREVVQTERGSGGVGELAGIVVPAAGTGNGGASASSSAGGTGGAGGNGNGVEGGGNGRQGRSGRRSSSSSTVHPRSTSPDTARAVPTSPMAIPASPSSSRTRVIPIDIAPRDRSSSIPSGISTSMPAPANLPGYSPRTLSTDIPSYESVIDQSAAGLRRMRLNYESSSNAQPRYPQSSAEVAHQIGQTPVDDSPLRAPPSAWLGINVSSPSRPTITEPAESEESDDDDPLVPRIRRIPPPSLASRRNTFSGISSLPNLHPVLPVQRERRDSVEGGTRLRHVHLNRDDDVFEEDETDETESGPDMSLEGTSDSDSAPNAHAHDPPPAVPTTRAEIDAGHQPVVDPSFDSDLAMQPLPPALNLLPPYNPHLAPQEIRLISTVHLDQAHPSQSFFTALANSLVHAAPVPADDPQRDQPQPYTTGGRKMKLTLTKGGYRMNQSATGPLYVKLGRGGRIEGKVEVGKVDYASSVEVSIIGLVNTSYYVRGQYTLIDTLPLVRRQIQLYPPTAENAETNTTGIRDEFDLLTGQAPGGSTADPPRTAPAPTGNPLARSISSGILPKLTASGRKQSRASKMMTKEGVPYLEMGQTFEFGLTMPHSHYRDGQAELPPSCQVYQVGMQAGVEYVLRIKMGRKGWRLNESITLPIIYEPQAYITPRRLRALTTNDALNPGWRTIRLHGGKPNPKTTPPPETPPPAGSGVEATLLLPSPPILYFAQGEPPPPIPFHLHFHSPTPLPLETFSDPRKSNFVIRLMRVATLRIGTEKEIRRMEIPSVVEIWQEGGPRARIGDSVGGGGSVAGFTLVPGQEELHPMEGRGSENGEGDAGDGVSGGVQHVQTEAVPATPPQPIGTSPASTTGPSATASPTSPDSTTGRRRLSFLRRRSSDVSTSPTTHTSPLARVLSNIPSIPETTAFASSSGDPSSSLPSAAPEPAEGPNIFTPVPVGCTDIHLLGHLTITPKITGTDVARRMVQSFNTPDIGITYVLEVGIQPKVGAIRENFDHVWGGGIVEIVLAPKTEDARGSVQIVAA